jgi:hypothetical protein
VLRDEARIFRAFLAPLCEGAPAKSTRTCGFRSLPQLGRRFGNLRRSSPNSPNLSTVFNTFQEASELNPGLKPSGVAALALKKCCNFVSLILGFSRHGEISRPEACARFSLKYFSHSGNATACEQFATGDDGRLQSTTIGNRLQQQRPPKEGKAAKKRVVEHKGLFYDRCRSWFSRFVFVGVARLAFQPPCLAIAKRIVYGGSNGKNESKQRLGGQKNGGRARTRTVDLLRVEQRLLPNPLITEQICSCKTLA